MSAVIPFSFEGARVRVLMRDEAPWFVAADVCRVLEIANPRDAAQRLDDDEKDTVVIADGIRGPGNPNVTIISESGLYALILTSRKPAARRFRKWVTAEVLPAIRRTGSYALDGVEPAPAPALEPGDIRAYVAMVHECRATWGRAAARRLWLQTPLPRIDVEPAAAAGDAVAEAQACLDRLLAFRPDGGEPVGALIAAARAARHPDAVARAASRALKNYGLEVKPAPADRATGRPKWPGLFLWVATRHAELARRGLRLEGLCRLPGARANVPFWAGGQVKAVLVPIELCRQDQPDAAAEPPAESSAR